MSETAEQGSSAPTTAVADISDTESFTVRDQVWDAVLVLLQQRPLPFRVWRVRKRAGLDRSQDRTIRRTLSVMADAGWLSHDDNSPWWHPGPKAETTFENY